MTSRAPLATVCVLGLLGCGPEPVPEVNRVNLAVQGDNGVSLNGTTFGGLTMSGAYEESWTVGGNPFVFPTGPFNPSNPFDPVAGVGPNGPALDGLQLSHLGSIVIDEDVDVADVLGAELEGEIVGDASDVMLKIAGVAAGAPPNDDILYYIVYIADGLGWSPLCGMDSGGQPVPAIAVPGVWNHEKIGKAHGGEWKNDKKQFSFACRGSSIAKCVEIGYKPWVEPKSRDGEIVRRKKRDLDKENHLQACVRMLRADYCGDGVPWTVNGRRVEFWDTMQMYSEDMNWTFEAAWGPKGAECLATPRVAFERMATKLEDGMPKCVKRRLHNFEQKSECMESGKSFRQLYDRHKLIFSSFETQL